jgi:hypothetical protein
MRNRKPGVFISHSTSGAFVVKVSSIITLKKITLLLFIHQLLSLSSKSQAIKRVIYSLFATKILFSSKQFLLDWNKVIRNSNILRLLPIKPQEFVRMGVYLPRLCWNGWTKKQVCKENTPNLIFLSRPTRWKGFEKFLQISSSFTSTKICMLIFKPSLNNVNESNFESFFKKLSEENDKFIFTSDNLIDSSDIDGFPISKINSFSDTSIDMVVSNLFFGGPIHIITDINFMYYNLLSETLNQGLMGSDK